VQAYGITTWYVDDIISKMKSGYQQVSAPFNDKTALPKDFMHSKELTAFLRHYDIQLTAEMLGTVLLPNSLPSMIAVGWMKYFFSLVGDSPPCGSEEIHLDPILKKSVHEEYVKDMNHYEPGGEPISERAFLELWKRVFPHVKRRKFKHCCGKCALCATLSDLRSQFQDPRGRKEVSPLLCFSLMSAC
jgi:hypothetical protein